MAELLGIIAGGAGLASLALQLVEGGQKLRHRYKNAKGLEGNVSWLSQDIELIGRQLIQLESSAPSILQEQLGPIMLERCRSRSASVAARLDSLTEEIPITVSKREIIRATFRSGQWRSELDELQCLVTGLKQDISQLYIVEHHALMQQIRKQAVATDSECATLTTASSTEIIHGKYSTADQRGITQCSVRNCNCSCHKKRTISGMFWRLRYSPLVEMFRPCDSPSCTARHYRIDIRLVLNRCSVPFKVTLGLDVVVEPGRYSLQPSLEIETVVDYTAPEYGIMRKLTTKQMDWTTAEKEFRAIYRSNPKFVNQVNMQGEGFLEGRIGDSPPLHFSVLHESDEVFEALVKRTPRPLEQHVNFLGQTVLHLAVQQPSRVVYLLGIGHEVDPCDKNGMTPLLYAARMNLPDTAIILLEHAARLIVNDDEDVKKTARSLLFWGDWNLFWAAIDFTVTTQPDATRLILHYVVQYCVDDTCYSAHESDGMRSGCFNFWAKVVSTLGSPNIIFEDGRTLMHVVCQPEGARALIQLGFDRFNNRDSNGESCLFRLVQLADSSLVRLAVASGSDVNMTNNSKYSILHTLLDSLMRSDGPTIPEFLKTLDILLDQEVDVSARDCCSCKCSAGGRLPCSIFSRRGSIYSKGSLLTWFEWIEVLEERGLVAEAKEACLAYLRRIYFDEAGLHHSDSSCVWYRHVHKISDDRFWDIPEQIAIDNLESMMQDLSEKDYADCLDIR
ncbi:hypothetical protein FLONG3_8452 [Fusarium longipes]|uniref:Ankyrin n=1 Tax=Fusarium longipes TaxID=694270 RepID=A0A395S542_9HYPO|nr:hypothetical protein FLONG3_8452 [Fusarium longipes]